LAFWTISGDTHRVGALPNGRESIRVATGTHLLGMVRLFDNTYQNIMASKPILDFFTRIMFIVPVLDPRILFASTGESDRIQSHSAEMQSVPCTMVAVA
jgi:hypothetical protein